MRHVRLQNIGGFRSRRTVLRQAYPRRPFQGSGRISEFTAGWRGWVAWSEESRSGFWDSPSSGEASRASAASITADDIFRFRVGESVGGDAFRFVPEAFLDESLRLGGAGIVETA